MAKIDLKNIVIGLVMLIILFIVVLNMLGFTANDFIASADNVSGSGLPMASLFSSNGILALVLMFAIFVTLMIVALKHFSNK